MGIFTKKDGEVTPEVEVTAEETANVEAAEQLAEDKVEEAMDLANEDKEPGEFMSDGAAEKLEELEEEIPEGYRVATPEEMKAITDFEETFGAGAHPLTVMVNLANRIKELEKKVF